MRTSETRGAVAMGGTTLSLAVPIGVSGAFLHDPGRFIEIHRLSAEFGKVKARLEEVEVRLRNCNEPEWLFRFGKTCERKKGNPKEELPALAEKLEADRARLRAQMEELQLKLREFEPTLNLTTHSLVETASALQLAPRPTQRMQQPEVAARNAVVDAHLDDPNPAICEILDQEFPYTDRPASELPDLWFRDFGVKTFVEAYKKCPNRVQKLISVRRRKHGLP